MVLHIGLCRNLINEVQFLQFLLQPNPLLLEVELLLGLLRPEVRLMKSFVLLSLNKPSLSILYHLQLNFLLVRYVILLFEHLVMAGDNVLLFLLPAELLSFKVANVFHFIALLLESLVRLVVNFLQVLNILLALGLRMVVYFERALRSHEVGVCIVVVSARDFLAAQSQADQLVNALCVILLFCVNVLAEGQSLNIVLVEDVAGRRHLLNL